MKICVFSDSHGDPDKMTEIIREEKPDQVFFLGDGESDIEEVRRTFPYLAVAAVRGNCDLFSELPADRSCTVGGVRCFLTHGHRYGVKYDPFCEGLRAAAVHNGARAAFFGHTHEAYLDERNGLLVMNPGSVRGYGASYGVLEIRDGEISPRIIRM